MQLDSDQTPWASQSSTPAENDAVFDQRLRCRALGLAAVLGGGVLMGSGSPEASKLVVLACALSAGGLPALALGAGASRPQPTWQDKVVWACTTAGIAVGFVFAFTGLR